MRDDSNEKPCISFLAREVQPAAKVAKARVGEEKGDRPLGPVRTAATDGWTSCPWPFTPRAEPVISFEGQVAEETFKMANDEKPTEKVIMASSSVAVTSEDSVNSNLATFMVDSAASDHYFAHASIHDFRHRLQDYVHFTTPSKVLTAGGVLLNGTAEGVLQGFLTDDNSNEILGQVYIVVVPGMGITCFW